MGKNNGVEVNTFLHSNHLFRFCSELVFAKDQQLVLSWSITPAVRMDYDTPLQRQGAIEKINSSQLMANH